MTFIDRLKLFGKAAMGLFTGISEEQLRGMMIGLFPGGSGAPPKRGTKELLNAYNDMPWLRAVANKVSRSVSSATWRLYVVSRNGKAVKAINIQQADYETRQAFRKQSGEIKEIENHPLLELLNFANPFMTGLVARQLMQIYLDLAGEAFLLKERNGAGMPVAIWPLPPDWVVDTPAPGDPTYRISFRAFNAEIPETEILWIADPDPSNPYGRGSGMARALADELETDEYAAKHTKSWFYNRARPDIIVSADGLSPEDTKRLEQDWLNKNQGFWRVYKPYFLSKKVDVQALSQTFENMQLVDLRKYERDTIIQVYGVPPEILGIIESSNRATIEASDYLYSRWVVQPRLEFIRSYLQEKLVPEFDDRLILDYDSPIPEDKEYALKVAQAAPWSITVDEWREMQNKGALPNGQGQGFMLPFNVYFSKELGDSQETQPTPAGKTAKKAITKDRLQDLLNELLKAIDEGVLADAMRPVYEAIVEEFGQRILVTIGVNQSFDLLDPRIIHFLNTEAGKFIRGINDTTLEAVKQQLAEGVGKGESMKELAKRVEDVFDDADSRRSMIIARTETIRASNFGGYEGMRQGGVEQKEWLATRDERVREEHLEMDGQIQPIDKPFIAPNGEEAMYPGDFGVPELDIQCRCTVAPVLEERSIYDTEEKRVAAWKQFDTDTRQWERMMRMAVRRAFRQQRENALAVLEGGEVD